jgi:hypothetical protein
VCVAVWRCVCVSGCLCVCVYRGFTLESQASVAFERGGKPVLTTVMPEEMRERVAQVRVVCLRRTPPRHVTPLSPPLSAHPCQVAGLLILQLVERHGVKPTALSRELGQALCAAPPSLLCGVRRVGASGYGCTTVHSV